MFLENNNIAGGVQTLNKFVIEDWAPKVVEEQELKTNKAKKRIMSFDNSQKENESDDELEKDFLQGETVAVED